VEDAFDGVGTEERRPAIGFGQFVGQALLAPVGMLLAECDHLLFDDSRSAPGALGCSAGKLLQGRIAALLEAGFPDIEGTAPDVGGTTGEIDIAGRFPRLEQQAPLLGRGQGKMDVFARSRTC
jgi:hypothetical protein